MEFELKIIEFLQAGRTPFFDVAFQIISLMGSFVGVIFVFLFLFIFKRKLSYYFAGSYAVTYVVMNVIKMLVKRIRPYNASDAIISIGDTVSSYSMPSGHMTTACVLAIFLGIFFFSVYKDKLSRGLAVGFLVVYVLLVGLSRMYLGKHYLTDLIVGAILAGVIGVISIIVIKKIENRKKKKVENDEKIT